MSWANGVYAITCDRNNSITVSHDTFLVMHLFIYHFPSGNKYYDIKEMIVICAGNKDNNNIEKQGL